MYGLKKYISVTIICLVFVMFVCFVRTSETVYNVLNVINPFEIAVDFNHNDTIDDDEIVKILDGYQYLAKEDIENGKFANIPLLSQYPKMYSALLRI